MNRFSLSRAIACSLVLACTLPFLAQEQGNQKSEQANNANEKIDPLALKVLKAATDRIHNAKAYSFHAAVSRESLGTNGQVITQFSTSETTVQQPSKLHVNFRGQGKDVQLIYNTGETVLFAPETKLYTAFLRAGTIDAAIQVLQENKVFLPTANFLQSDPYQSLTRDLTEAYVIGRVDLAGDTVHQLAFVEPHAEWQLWVTGGPEPTIRKLEVINTEEAYHPRIIVDFSDWDFNVSPDTSLFTFHIAGAQKIGVLKSMEKKP
ncbi:MAG TPA: DUF2092 domain-containing protein [Candidatus Sulfotelmatobacter sp.]|nr:DUF2092 domain-containing protein [Candidatus Sulfotelmatobacter sp.]